MKNRKPKGNALKQKFWRESQARRNMDPAWKPLRIRSAKGKTGYTRQEWKGLNESIRRLGEVGRVEGVRFIESPPQHQSTPPA